MDISVVIATHNQAERLRLVLCGLQQQSLATERFEVLVVNDGCTDGTVDVLKERCMDNLSAIVLRPNQGRNAARNWGIESAQGELLVFLDGDALPAPDLLKCYWAAYLRYGERAIYSGFQYSLPGLEYFQDPQTGSLASVPMPSVQKDFLDKHRDEYIVTEERICGDFAGVRALAKEGGYPFPELEKRQRQVRRLLNEVPDARCAWLGFIPHNGAIPAALLAEGGGFDEQISFSEGWELAYRLQRQCAAVVRATEAETFHLYHYHDFADPEQGNMRVRAIEYMVAKHHDERLRLLYCWLGSLWPDSMLPEEMRVRDVLEMERRYEQLSAGQWRDYQVVFERHPTLGEHIKREVESYASCA